MTQVRVIVPETSLLYSQLYFKKTIKGLIKV